MELTLAETGQPEQQADGAPASDELLEPEVVRYEVGLRNLLGAIEAVEEGSATGA